MAAPTNPYPRYLDWARYLSAFLLFTYGLSKLLGRQFTLPPEIALRPVGSLSGYQLAWSYYSYSHSYAAILGLVQLACSALLLFRRTSLPGRRSYVAGDDEHLDDQCVFFHSLGRNVHFGIYLCVHVGRTLASSPSRKRVLDPASIGTMT